MKQMIFRLPSALVLALLVFTAELRAQTTWTFTTLHSFSALSARSTNADGSYSKAGLAQGSDGNFYGTTPWGGRSGQGVVFQMTPAGALTTLHSFSTPDADENNADGAIPYARLIQGADGNFYGTTWTGGRGGTGGQGVIFRITSAGVLVTLHDFTDGSVSYTGLVEGRDGALYGTTMQGGDDNLGTVFRVTPAGEFTTLHSFARDSSEGVYPEAGLVPGSDGNFYGTTTAGGSGPYGTAFQITPAGVLTVLHRFTGGMEGSAPSGLIQGSDGNFYGVTSDGGDQFQGTFFQLTPAGALTNLHSFVYNGSDAYRPSTSLIQGSDGNFYGTTSVGGSADSGTIYRLTPTGALTTLHSFTGHGTDGISPDAGLIRGSDGNFYGTTSSGGSANSGTVFRLSTGDAGATVPNVSITVAGDGFAYEGGAKGKVWLERSGDTSTALTVHCKVKGSAVAGRDYQPIPAFINIPAGETRTKLKIRPIDGSPNAGTLTLKVAVSPPLDGSYVVGGTDTAKIKLVGH